MVELSSLSGLPWDRLGGEMLRLTNREVSICSSMTAGDIVLFMGDNAYEVVACHNCAVEQDDRYVYTFRVNDPARHIFALVRSREDDVHFLWTNLPKPY